MSDSDNFVSSRISRFAAAAGLRSVLSIDPEQTAHLPLSCDHQRLKHSFPEDREDRKAYLYVDTSWLRLNRANVNPEGEFGDVQMNEDTTALCLKFEAMLV